MTWRGRLISFFPALAFSLIGASTVAFIVGPSLATGAWVLFQLYGFPLLCFRLHQWLAPLEEGVSRISSASYSAWYGAHQLQLLYVTFPALEKVLRLFPGVFSFWLRLWGARIGKRVYWTPQVEIIDRNLLEVGDGVIFGQQVILCSHYVIPRRNSVALFVKTIRIGSGAFIGAGSRIGPGAIIKEGSFLPYGSTIYPNRVVHASSDGTHAPAQAQSPGLRTHLDGSGGLTAKASQGIGPPRR